MTMEEKKELGEQNQEVQEVQEHVHGPGCDHGHDHHPHHSVETFVRKTPKLGRNEACHCGSGKKFKKCHGG